MARPRNFVQWHTNTFIPWHVSVDGELEELERGKLSNHLYNTDQVNYTTWKRGIDAKLEGFDDFDKWQSNADKRLRDFDKWQSGADKKFGDFDKWQSSTDKKLGDFDTWRIDTNNKLGGLETQQAKTDSRLGEFDAWQKDAKADLANLNQTKLDTQRYIEDQKNVFQRLNGFTGLTTDFNNLKSALHKTMPQIQGRLDSLESKTNALEGRVSEHDSQIASFDGEFLKVRSEIQKSNDGLGQRIAKQGKKMDEGFEELKGLINQRPNKACRNARPTGAGDDGEDPASPSSTAVAKARGGGPDLSNRVNFNISQHAPNCTLLHSNSHNTDAAPYYGAPCPCQGPFLPPGMVQSPWMPVPLGNPFAAPAPPAPQPRRPRAMEHELYEPRHVRHRRRSHSDLGEGASNYNFTPHIKVALGRQTGGGLFSKPKKEGLIIGLGSGGGGGEVGRRRKHTSSSGFDMFS